MEEQKKRGGLKGLRWGLMVTVCRYQGGGGVAEAEMGLTGASY